MEGTQKRPFSDIAAKEIAALDRAAGLEVPTARASAQARSAPAGGSGGGAAASAAS